MFPKTTAAATQQPPRTAFVIVCEWLALFIALTTFVGSMWLTVQVNSFAYSIVFYDTKLNTTTLAWSVALLSIVLGGVFIQSLFYERMNLSRWFDVKHSLALAAGFCMGTAFSLVIDILGSYGYAAYVLTHWR